MLLTFTQAFAFLFKQHLMFSGHVQTTDGNQRQQKQNRSWNNAAVPQIGHLLLSHRQREQPGPSTGNSEHPRILVGRNRQYRESPPNLKRALLLNINLLQFLLHLAGMFNMCCEILKLWLKYKGETDSCCTNTEL